MSSPSPGLLAAPALLWQPLSSHHPTAALGSLPLAALTLTVAPALIFLQNNRKGPPAVAQVKTLTQPSSFGSPCLAVEAPAQAQL